MKAKTAKTLQGDSIYVNITDKGAMINKSKLVLTDLDASNGVIHVIDTVLMPPAKGANVQQTLHNAIVQGTYLFNAGHHEACATVYHQTLQGLMSTNVDASLKTHMTSVMKRASQQQCCTERAWTLRHGIDQMVAQMVVSN